MKKNVNEFLDLKEIGKRLRETRLSFGLSQEAVAKAFGYTKQQISHWELGLTIINVVDLVRFSFEFDVSVNWLLFGK